MDVRRLATTVGVLLAIASAPEIVSAQDAGVVPATETANTSASAEPTGPTLEAYMQLLGARRIIAAETGSVERLRTLVRRAEDLYLDERWDEAALLLFEVAESPRFADFQDNDEFRSAEYMLAGCLAELGALRTANRYLDRIIARGPEDSYYGPAYRRAVDVALAGGSIDASVARLEAFGTVDGTGDAALPADAANELRYLRGRARYDEGEFDGAALELEAVTRRSRFYASAQYLRGAIAAKKGDLEEAEARFCEITGTGDREQSTFYVDWRYFEVKDLARLGLGRVAHEGHRGDDAFYYYFQVPADSGHVSEALFEASYAMYEGGDFDTALDLLDQLQNRFPESPFVDEASILRGYIHLGRCEFDDANREFVKFQQRFQPIVEELDQVLASPARQERLYAELLEEERRESQRTLTAPPPGSPEAAANANAVSTTSLRGTLLALLRVDPAFYRLNADVRTLDAESARAGRLSTELGAIRARIDGNDRPRAADTDAAPPDEVAELRAQLADTRTVLAALTEQLDAMRRPRGAAGRAAGAVGATREQLQPLEVELRTASTRIRALEERVREAERANPEASAPPPPEPGNELQALIAVDVQAARALPARVAAVRGRMVLAANDAALRTVRRLRGRLAAEVRRARIGRIDAVMGSKRRVEIQIESLAAGRFPAELIDPLSVQGLLRDDEEYWPFEGENWSDEYEQPSEDDEEDLEVGAEGLEGAATAGPATDAPASGSAGATPPAAGGAR